MPRVKSQSSSELDVKMRPALTPEAEEAQMISLAVDRAKQQLIDGTASSQVITHYLKLGAEREKRDLENARLQEEVKLLRAKTEALEREERLEERYIAAIEAMKSYQGHEEEVEDYDEY
jgi:hypothetical protein